MGEEVLNAGANAQSQDAHSDLDDEKQPEAGDLNEEKNEDDHASGTNSRVLNFNMNISGFISGRRKARAFTFRQHYCDVFLFSVSVFCFVCKFSRLFTITLVSIFFRFRLKKNTV